VDFLDSGERDRFMPVYGETEPEIADKDNAANVTKCIFCSGKIYYELLQYRKDRYATF
jgi:2-oxoglutarate dehydrogenase complex dehydrogenase (E1) component-like enzyme